jgi:AcrR family transcriptional regulator
VTAADATPRDLLLASVIDAIERNGLGSRSLRDLAADAGTSHRMLIHHFGSREGLLIAIVTEVEARQRDLLRDQSGGADDLLAATWAQVRDPALWPFERLFFECYARGAQGEAPFDRLLPALVDDWLAAFPRGRNRDQARLGLAVVRGLLLDLVATEDRAGVDRALREFRSLLVAAATPG